MEHLTQVVIEFLRKVKFLEVIISTTLVLGIMVVPKINLLKFLMPLDENRKWITFVFAILLSYIFIVAIEKSWDIVKAKISKRKSEKIIQYENEKKENKMRQNELKEREHYINLYNMLDAEKKTYIKNSLLKNNNKPQRLRIDNNSITYLIRTRIVLNYTETYEILPDYDTFSSIESYMCYLNPIIFDYIVQNKEDTQNANT